MMKRVNNEWYYRNVSEALNWLVTMIRQDNRQNIQSLNIHAEAFFAEFLNALYGWGLINANAADQNAPGIDLWYEGGKVVVQVSSTFSHDKIQRSLNKTTDERYHGSRFCFVAITEKTQAYRDFTVPEGISFDKDADVLDVDRLLNAVLNAGIDRQRALSDLVDKYFAGEAARPQVRCLTRLPDRADSGNVICRGTELDAVCRLLHEGKDILLMSGFGGIGKTALARLVFYRVKDEYDEVAWVPYSGRLIDSMVAAFLLPEEYRTPEDRWNRIAGYSRDGLKKLIVVDNADCSGKQDPRTDEALKALSRWPRTSVIVTSRLDELGAFHKQKIGFLSPEDCVDLFYLYYQNDPERRQLAAAEKLVELALYHTLTIELFAKGAKRVAGLDAYYETLRTDLPAVSRQFTTGRTDKMDTIEGHLRALFILQNRSPEEKEALWSFAVLPPYAALTAEEAEGWFGLPEAVLGRLADDGWLRWEDGFYSMHPLVRQIIRLDPVPEGTAGPFLDFIEDDRKGYFPEDMVYTELTRRLELAEAVTEAVCKDGDTVRTAHLLHNLGDTCRQLARYGDAVKYYEKSLKITEAVLGPEHLSTAATCNNLATVYDAMGDYPKALEYYEKTRNIDEAVNGPAHPDTATTYNNLANVYYDMGDCPKALEYHEKAREIREAVLGPEHPDTATTYNNLANVYSAMGNYPKALEYYEKALKIKEAVLGPEHPDTAITWHNLAILYLKLRDPDSAIRCSDRALAVCRRVLGPEHPYTTGTKQFNDRLHLFSAQPDAPAE